MTCHLTSSLNARLVTVIAACLAMTLSITSANAQELLGYWQLEETDFEVPAVDSSGNGLNGIFEGDIDPDVEGAPGFGSGALFDGATSQVLIEGGGDIFGALTNDFSVMAWINVDQFDHKNRIFGGFPVGGGWGFGTIRDELEITTYGVKDYDQPVPLELDTWTHVAVTLDTDNAAHFYVDGVFVGTQTHGAPGNPIANDFYIGASCCSSEFFVGELDEIGVFQGTLSESQIFNAMSNGVDQFNGGAAVPPVAVGERGAVGSEDINGSRQNQVFGDPGGDLVPGLGQSWYTGTAGTKASFDALTGGSERGVPYFHGQDGTWWSGANPSVPDIQDYPIETDGVFTGDAYSVKLEGEILIEESGTIRFLDGVDDYTYLAIDTDRSGVAGDSAPEVLIDDNSWTNALSTANGGAPIVEVDFQDIAADGEWLAIEFNMSEGGGGDAGIIYWDVMDEDDFFPTEQGEGVLDIDAFVFQVPDTHLRGPEAPAPLVSGDVTGSVPVRSSGWEIDVNPADGTADTFSLENPDADILTTILDIDGVEFHVNALSDVSEGDSFQVFLADSITGTPIIATEGWSFDAVTGSVVFGTVPPGLAGDINGSGNVDFADFLILSANFGTMVTANMDGDLDGDGNVAFPDFLILSDNFGASAASSVPEPSALALLSIGGLLGGLLRRRR